MVSRSSPTCPVQVPPDLLEPLPCRLLLRGHCQGQRWHALLLQHLSQVDLSVSARVLNADPFAEMTLQ